jgi:hypothetical protein
MNVKVLQALIQKLKSAPTEQMAREALAQCLPEVEELNRQQLEGGLRSDGKFITPKYKNPEYVNRKAQVPLAPVGTPDLKLKGDFHRGIKATVGSNGLEITSTDFKTKFLSPRYALIFGLSAESRSKLAENLRPIIASQFAKYIRGA